MSDHLSVGVDSILDGYIENPSELENIGKDHKTEPPKPNIITNRKEGLQTLKDFESSPQFFNAIPRLL